MNTLWRKAYRDLVGQRGRAGLVVLAVGIGIAAFFAVLASYAVLVRALDDGYRATNPAAIVLRVDVVDEALLAAVGDHPAVAEVEARRRLLGRLRVGPIEWRSLQLFVVPDFAAIRINRLEPQTGAWPPPVGELLLERDALGVARAGLGDTVQVRLPSGDEVALRVAGTVKDVGQAQARMENVVYGYVSVATLAALGESSHLDQILVRLAAAPGVAVDAAGEVVDEAHLEAVADELAALVAARGHVVQRVDIPEPGRHPHASLMGMLLLAMAAFGLLVLALAAILVGHLVTARMAAEVRQIGIMKAVGGARGQVARIYLAEAFLLGSAATLLALPLGLLGARRLCATLAGLLNFDITSHAVPPWVYALVVFAGWLVPVLAAARPVWQASGWSVRATLASRGVVGEAFVPGWFARSLGRLFERLPGRLGSVSRPALLILRSGMRQRGRLARTAATLVAGGLFFLVALNLRAALTNTLDRLFAARHYDLVVTLDGRIAQSRLSAIAAETTGVRAVEGWITTPATLLEDSVENQPVDPPLGGPPAHGHGAPGSPQVASGHLGGASRNRFSLVALPPDTRFLDLEVVAGRCLLAEDRAALVVNQALEARQPRLRPGSRVLLEVGSSRQEWQVVGVVREPFAPATAYASRRFFDHPGGSGSPGSGRAASATEVAVTGSVDGTGVATPAIARAGGGGAEAVPADGGSNSLRVQLARQDRESLLAAKRDLEASFARAGVRVLGAATQADGRYSFDQHMLMFHVFLLIMAAILSLVGGLGLATTLGLAVLERRREMGILRAIGATPGMIAGIVVGEGVLTALVGWLVSTILAGPLAWLLGDWLSLAMFATRLDVATSFSGIVAWLALALLLAVMASWAPARRAARSSVVAAIRYD